MSWFKRNCFLNVHCKSDFPFWKIAYLLIKKACNELFLARTAPYTLTAGDRCELQSHQPLLIFRPIWSQQHVPHSKLMAQPVLNIFNLFVRINGIVNKNISYVPNFFNKPGIFYRYSLAYFKGNLFVFIAGLQM